MGVKLMEIEYYFGEHDWVAFMVYHTSHSPSVKRRLGAQRYGFGLMLLVFGILLVLQSSSFSWVVSGFWAVACFGSAVLWLALWPVYWRGSIHANSLKMLNEGDNRAVIGKHKLRVEDDGLIELTDYLECKTRWAAFEKIISTDDYTFIYISSVQAVVIPKASITSGDHDVFVSAVRERHAAHREP
jgi:hypothetical protein